MDSSFGRPRRAPEPPQCSAAPEPAATCQLQVLQQVSVARPADHAGTETSRWLDHQKHHSPLSWAPFHLSTLWKVISPSGCSSLLCDGYFKPWILKEDPPAFLKRFHRKGNRLSNDVSRIASGWDHAEAGGKRQNVPLWGGICWHITSLLNNDALNLNRLRFTKPWWSHLKSQVVSAPPLILVVLLWQEQEHRITSQRNMLSSFLDQQCPSEEPQPARGRSRWLALRPWSPSSCPESLWSACVTGPTLTEHPGDGELITALNLMNYRNELSSKKTETLADAWACQKGKKMADPSRKIKKKKTLHDLNWFVFAGW